ncbi:hypothetical protein CTAYLR_007004 [Chrysophaeum taylorii]|uniref:Radical SAM core domain-containing protein n=1 Tax=Chrysophaeum taylorii TaxID=2483200 RepID=A0AAD7XJW6_9STRA|nr:hypothetical protein CTAYLR_007004 [Chrysophaeum taylorii]
MSHITPPLAFDQRHTTFQLPEVVSFRESRDGTCKWLLDAGEGSLVDAVLIPDRVRNTLCVSSQIGCMLDCSFCSTGKLGFNGNLPATTIVAQALIANAHLDDLAFGISKRRVTISTADVVPAIYRLAEDTDVALAISLHAPDDELRNKLVPINCKYAIAELLDACLHYVDHLGDSRKLVIEYTLMKGVDDTQAHAHALALLLRDVHCKVNLIPFNPFPTAGYERPTPAAVRAFQTALMQLGYAISQVSPGASSSA